MSPTRQAPTARHATPGSSLASRPPPGARLSRVDLLADARQLAELLETAHPDPYTRGGGRVAFDRRVHEILDAIPPEGLTAREFLRRVRPLVASLRDGHTQIHAAAEASGARRTWVDLEAVGERLYVAAVYRDLDRPALGKRIVAVEGVPWDELVSRMASFRGADNAYNNLRHLSQAIVQTDVLEDLLGLDGPLAEVRVELESPGAPRTTLALRPTSAPPPRALRPESHVSLPPTNAADLGWGFLAADRSVAVLRVDSMMRYREAFEGWRATGFLVNLGDHLKDVVRKATGQTPPDSQDEGIARIPSATETFERLFAAMRDAKTRALIVDLRANEGGNSAMDLVLGSFLYSPDELLATDEGYQVPRYSRLYFENYRSASLERLRAEHWALLEVGDLDFSEERAWRAAKATGQVAAERERRARDLAARANLMPTFDAALRAKKVGVGWSGSVVALASARTYSAGFDLLAMLVKHGARTVGVPSSQAGNCFIDGLEFHLTHSGLGGSISYKRSLMFPDDDARGEMLRPDVELTPERYAGLGFDPDASVMLALEMLARAPSAR